MMPTSGLHQLCFVIQARTDRHGAREHRLVAIVEVDDHLGVEVAGVLAGAARHQCRPRHQMSTHTTDISDGSAMARTASASRTSRSGGMPASPHSESPAMMDVEIQTAVVVAAPMRRNVADEPHPPASRIQRHMMSVAARSTAGSTMKNSETHCSDVNVGCTGRHVVRP